MRLLVSISSEILNYYPSYHAIPALLVLLYFCRSISDSTQSCTHAKKARKRQHLSSISRQQKKAMALFTLIKLLQDECRGLAPW